MQQKVGIFSGTFDPVHTGHIAFANEALKACKLDEVIFLPEQRPRDKQRVTDMKHRLALLGHATADDKSLRVLELKSKQFTVRQTLPELRRLLGESRLTLLVGSDVARTFLYRWDGLEELLQEVNIAIGLRAHDEAEDMTTIMEHLSEEYAVPVSYTILKTTEAHAASSLIRSGTAGTSQLHPNVQSYAQKHLLYTKP